MIWKILLPEYREECEGLADQAVGLHLWNNIIDEMGYWKAMAPPAGSFLYALLAADGSDRFFRGEYPIAVMHQLVRNFRLRKNGGDLGIKQIVRQFFPSMKRTWKHYYG